MKSADQHTPASRCLKSEADNCSLTLFLAEASHDIEFQASALLGLAFTSKRERGGPQVKQDRIRSLHVFRVNGSKRAQPLSQRH